MIRWWVNAEAGRFDGDASQHTEGDEPRTPTSNDTLVYTQRNAVTSIPPDLTDGAAEDLDYETPFYASCAEEATFSLPIAGLCGYGTWKAILIRETTGNSGPAVTRKKHIRYSATIDLADALNFEESYQRGESKSSL